MGENLDASRPSGLIERHAARIFSSRVCSGNETLDGSGHAPPVAGSDILALDEGMGAINADDANAPSKISRAPLTLRLNEINEVKLSEYPDAASAQA